MATLLVTLTRHNGIVGASRGRVTVGVRLSRLIRRRRVGRSETYVLPYRRKRDGEGVALLTQQEKDSDYFYTPYRRLREGRLSSIVYPHRGPLIYLLFPSFEDTRSFTSVYLGCDGHPSSVGRHYSLKGIL